MKNKAVIIKGLITLGFCLFFVLKIQAQADKDAIDIRRIWDRGNHNAFTDIIFFKGKFYVVFREGDGHIPNKDNTGNGKIRILTSKDAEFWESHSLLELDGIDLRDPKISVTPKNRLLIIMGGSNYENGSLKSIATYTSMSDPNGNRFAQPEKVALNETLKSDFDWIWRITWYEKVGYGVLYQSNVNGDKDKTRAYLVKTTKGTDYELITELQIDGKPNESTIRFLSGAEMAILVRREGDDKMGMLGTSKAPYTDWTWEKLDFRLGGPNFEIIPINKILITSRIYADDGPYTALLLGKKNEGFKEVMRLPSGGDCSYAGMITISGYVWMSYYSSHEGKTSIYYARIPYSKLQEQ